MKKMDFSKHLLAICMMLFCFGLTTISAQADAIQSTSNSSSDISFAKADKDVVKQNIMLEIKSLKTSIQGVTPGSVAYVDGMRRIDTFVISYKSLEEGSSAFAAYNAGVRYLFEKVQYKATEQAQLDQIQQTLHNMFIY